MRMALKINMTRTEIVDFLDKELVPQVQTEINGLIWPRKKHGAYFITVRQILCMVDFLGAVYCGYPLAERKVDKNGLHISKSEKAVKFILKYFAPKATYNKNTVQQLYTMYRHGLVHLYQPRYLRLSNKKVLKWFFYRGNRHLSRLPLDTDSGRVVVNNVKHLEIINIGARKNLFHLPICVDALCEDFMQAIETYKTDVAAKKTLQRKWRTTVNAICKPRKL